MYKKVGILVFLILLMPVTTLAWDDCPFELVDDPYPGECNKYIDTDNDGLCDHSQSAPEDRDQATSTELEVEIEHEDDKSKLVYSALTVFVFLLIIISYVQYRKKYD